MKWINSLKATKFQNSPKEEIGNICIKEMESTGKNLKNKLPGPMASLVNSIKLLKNK